MALERAASLFDSPGRPAYHLGAITSWSFRCILAKPLIARFGPILVTACSVIAGAPLLSLRRP